jgi:hypothetical protein
VPEICEHGVEHCIYCEEQPCRWTGCPAVAQTEPRVYCSVHQPESVLERVRNIITDRVFRAAAPLPLKYQRVLVDLERKIMDDLKGTT